MDAATTNLSDASAVNPPPSSENPEANNLSTQDTGAPTSHQASNANDPISSTQSENSWSPPSDESQIDPDDQEDDEDDDESDMEDDEEHSDYEDCDCENCVRKTKTIKAAVERIEIFKEVGDKHFIEIQVAPLRSEDHWFEWVIGIELILRMHQVWSIVIDPDFEPLARDHDYYHWSERMIDVAIAAIYANVSEEVRKDKCFLSAVVLRDPPGVMNNLWRHYGGGVEGDPHA